MSHLFDKAALPVNSALRRSSVTKPSVFVDGPEHLLGEKMPQRAPSPQGWSRQRWALLPRSSREAAPTPWVGSPGSGEGKQPALRADVVWEQLRGDVFLSSPLPFPNAVN